MNPPLRNTYLAALLLALTGCATVPGPAATAPPVTWQLPGAWSRPAPAEGGPMPAAPDPARAPAAAAPSPATAADGGAPAATALTGWWRLFGDATLDGLVDQSLARHTSVRDAVAALQQARAARDSAAAGGRPTLGATASAQGSATEGAGRGQTWQAGLDASWEIDLFGAQRAARDAAQAGVQQAQATLGQARVSLAAEVVLSYVDLRSAQARLALAQDSLATQTRSRQITAWRVQAGLDTAVSAAQARTAEAQAQAALPALVAALASARHALAVLSGQPPAALDAQLASAAALPGLPAEPVPAVPAALLQQRGDVVAAQAAVFAARATLDQVQAQRWPSLTLSGSVGLQAASLGGLGAAPLAASALASLAASLIDGGARQAAIDSQDATLQRAQIAWEAAVLTALQEVEDALANLQAQRDKTAALQSAADAAQAAATLAEQRYASGLIDYPTVLDTQRTWLTARDSLALTRAAALQAHVQLAKALGGGWQMAGELPAETPAGAVAIAPDATLTAPTATPAALANSQTGAAVR